METNYGKDDPRTVIPTLCRQFYDVGWMTGTGGALSLKKGNTIYITPSGVQKELVQGDDLFVQNCEGTDVSLPPPEKKLRKSTCTPLINAVYTIRPGLGIAWLEMIETVEKNDTAAVFHLHTKASVMASLVWRGVEFRCTHLKMIQCIKKGSSDEHFDYYDTLIVPIVENKSTEDEIADSLIAAMKDYPQTSAVLIRRHGLYVWGPTWQKTKAMAEAYDYLFDIALQMKSHGLDPEEIPVPPEGAYL